MRSRDCFESAKKRVSGDSITACKKKGKLTFSSEEGDGGAVSTSTAGTANAMNIVLRIVRIIIVQHMSNVANVCNGNKISTSSYTSAIVKLIARSSGIMHLVLSAQQIYHGCPSPGWAPSDPSLSGILGRSDAELTIRRPVSHNQKRVREQRRVEAVDSADIQVLRCEESVKYIRPGQGHECNGWSARV